MAAGAAEFGNGCHHDVVVCKRRWWRFLTRDLRRPSVSHACVTGDGSPAANFLAKSADSREGVPTL